MRAPGSSEIYRGHGESTIRPETAPERNKARKVRLGVVPTCVGPPEGGNCHCARRRLPARGRGALRLSIRLSCRALTCCLFRKASALEQFSKRMVPLVETRRVPSLLYRLNAKGSFVGKVHPFREWLYSPNFGKDMCSQVGLPLCCDSRKFIEPEDRPGEATHSLCSSYAPLGCRDAPRDPPTT